jgi:hypothetical protein
MSTTAPTDHTLVIRGTGPRITIKSATGTTVTVVSGTKAKTLTLGPKASVEFAA